MTLSPDTLTSNRVEVGGSLDEAIELCYERWMDRRPARDTTHRGKGAPGSST